MIAGQGMIAESHLRWDMRHEMPVQGPSSAMISTKRACDGSLMDLGPNSPLAVAPVVTIKSIIRFCAPKVALCARVHF